MAAGFDAKATSVTSSTGTNATETNSSLTIGASATLLIAFVNIADSTIPLPAACAGVTWNSVAMTLLGTKNDAGTSGGQTQVNVYGLVNPATGNHSLVASFTGRTGNTGVYLDGASWTGSDTSSLATAVPSANIILDSSVVAPGTGNYPALGPFAVTTASGDAAVAVANTWPGASPTMLTGTLLHSNNPENGLQIEGYNLASGASTNVQFNNMPGAQSACGIAFRIVQASGGGGTSVTVDFGGAFEFTRGVRSDGPVLLEYLATVRADRPLQLEAINAVRRDNIALPELLAGLSSNTAGQLEFLASTRSDDLAPLEMVSAFRADVVTLMETLSGQRSDAAMAGEIIASLRADLVGPLENLGAVNVVSDGAVQIETTVPVRSDSVASADMLSSVRRDTPAPIEETAGSSTQAGALAETVGSVRSDSTSQIEAGGTLRADAAISAETIGSVTSQSVATTENTTGVTRDAPVPQESLGGLSVIFSSALQLEFLGVAVNSAIEWILRARRRGNR